VTDRPEQLARIEQELRAALSILEAAMPTEAEDWVWVSEFIEHNEFGVAFDWIVDTLAETDAPAPAKPAFIHLERVYNEWGRTDHEDSWRFVVSRYSGP
jgi:hypothetical protein